MNVAGKSKTKFPEQDVFVAAVEETTPAAAWVKHVANCWICHAVNLGKRHSYCSDGTGIYERSLKAA